MKTLFTKIIFLVFSTCWLCHLSFAQTWQALGPIKSGQISVGAGTFTDIALDSNDNPFVVYSDFANNNRAIVKKFEGTNWVTVGDGYLSPGEASFTRIALDEHGIPFVVYQDGSTNSRATIKKFDGSSWINVGTPDISAGITSGTNLVLDAEGMPWIAYVDILNGSKAAVKKFDGNSWINVGEVGLSTGKASFTSLVLDKEGMPWIAYEDIANGSKATVKKFDGNSWINVGEVGFSLGRVSSTDLVLDANGNPIIAYIDETNSRRLTVKKYNGKSWIDIGTDRVSAGQAVSPSLALDINNNPFVAYTDLANGYKATVRKYTGTNWVDVGVPGFSAGHASSNSLAVDAEGFPILAFELFTGEFIMGSAAVMKYTQTPPSITTHPVATTVVGGQNASFSVTATGTALTYQWQEKRGDGEFTNISDGGVYSNTTSPILTLTQVPISMNGYEYRVQVSNAEIVTSNAVALTVNSPAFDNSRVWQKPNTTGISDFPAGFAALALNANGIPYVAFRDENNNYKTTVMKLDDSRWVTVGNVGFTAGQTYSNTLVINDQGTPYLSFIDGALNNKVTVMKFSGSKWEIVGKAGFSSGEAIGPSLSLDSNGIPYVAFMDKANGDKATVMKYVNGRWANVGLAGFTTGGAYANKIVLDASSTPYIAYVDGRGKSAVMKFNGNSWVDVGTTGFSAGEMGEFDLAVDTNGTLYLAYEDGANKKDPGRVKKYDGSSWVDVGNNGFSEGSAQYTSLALDASGTPFVAYTDWLHNGKATVSRYNGSNWEIVGTAAFSADGTQYFRLAVDAAGTPFVSFRDYGIAGRVTVMKFTEAIPTAPTGTGATNCGTGSMTLTASGAAEGKYRWYTTATGGSSITDSYNATFITPVLTATTTYYVSIVNGAAESERTAVTAVIKPVPTIPVVAGSLSYCQGATAAPLSATGINLKWYTLATGGVPLPEAPTPATVATGIINYYVSQTVDGCESQRAEITITINELPIVQAGDDQSVCVNEEPVTLTGFSPAEGSWSGPGVNAGGVFNPATAGKGTHKLTYKVTQNGCTTTSAKTITVTAAPTVTLTAFNNTLCSTNTGFVLSGGEPAGGTYSGTGVSNGIFDASIAGVGTHIITYTYTNDGCTATATQEITVSTCTGIKESTLAASLLLYPNPTSDKLHVIFPLPQRTTVEIRLWDAKGRQVLKESYPRVSGEFNQTLHLNSKAPGVYQLQFITNHNIINRRLIIK